MKSIAPLIDVERLRMSEGMLFDFQESLIIGKVGRGVC